MGDDKGCSSEKTLLIYSRVEYSILIVCSNNSLYYNTLYGFDSLHTYIIEHYNPSVRITAWQIFETLFHGRFIYSQNFSQKSAERKSPKKYFLKKLPLGVDV